MKRFVVEVLSGGIKVPLRIQAVSKKQAKEIAQEKYNVEKVLTVTEKKDYVNTEGNGGLRSRGRRLM